ncbi:MAG: hypothetical protein JWQ21_3993 [Herminiimonas sp.]|nr:hypothetical protein [Herminiimonas sp.]
MSHKSIGIAAIGSCQDAHYCLELEMWTCRKCRTQWEFSRLTPEIDNDGCHFICPVCNNRNPLINVGTADGPAELMQPDIELPPQKD